MLQLSRDGKELVITNRITRNKKVEEALPAVESSEESEESNKEEK